MWDGYATLQQPTGPNPNGIGIVDLILPSRAAKVDAAIKANWNKPASNNQTAPSNPSGSGKNPASPTNPPGAIPTQPGTGPPAPTFM